MKQISYRKNQFFHRNFNLDPFLIAETGPDEVRLSNSRLIRVQDDFGLFIIDMQATQQEDEP